MKMILRHQLTRFLKQKSFNLDLSRRYTVLEPPWKVLFFGTDDFSVASLKALCSEYRNGKLLRKLEVVTSIKPKQNTVHQFALQENLTIHNWPAEVAEGKFDVGVVVSFGYLIPEVIIKKFPFGMLNVHASLLPRWRGAAPIIYAIANGDTKTGVTVMRIKPKRFDVGEIVKQVEVEIPEHMQMPELHDVLAKTGANCLVSVLRKLPQYLENAHEQLDEGVTLAPKINPSFGRIKWKEMTARSVYNLHRSIVSMFPVFSTWKGVVVKFYDLSINKNNINICTEMSPGFVLYEKQTNSLKIQCSDRNFVSVTKLCVRGKTMSAKDFNNGFIKKVDVKCRLFD